MSTQPLAGRDRITCAALRDRLDDFLDGELTPAEDARMECLLHNCPSCHAIVAHERAVLAHVRRAVRSHEVPSWLHARISAALAFSLTGAGEGPAP